MFIATALYKNLTLDVAELLREASLSNNQRLGFFPVFETKEQASEFAENMLAAQGIELDKFGKLVLED